MTLHLMVTNLCNRNCKHCCNNKYPLEDIPIVSDEDFESVDTVCLTGGEPFEYANPDAIAGYLKSKYSNIKYVYCYTNARELQKYLIFDGRITYLDGVSISIKNRDDDWSFRSIWNNYELTHLQSNRVYDMLPIEATRPQYPGYVYYKREWQEDFKPAEDSIFRRLF